MDVKVFEVRDAATFIPVIAIHLHTRTSEEQYLLGRSGYENAEDYVLLSRLNEQGPLTWDPYGHGTDARTLQVAHAYIQKNWNVLGSGDVVDVEYILGERDTVKESEQREERFI